MILTIIKYPYNVPAACPTIINWGSMRRVDIPMCVADGAATTRRLDTSSFLGRVTQRGIWYRPGAVCTSPSSKA